MDQRGSWCVLLARPVHGTRYVSNLIFQTRLQTRLTRCTGPCRVVDANTTKFHPESWNSKANMFFIDQPVGVGWSYADFGERVVSTARRSVDVLLLILNCSSRERLKRLRTISPRSSQSSSNTSISSRAGLSTWQGSHMVEGISLCTPRLFMTRTRSWSRRV